MSIKIYEYIYSLQRTMKTKTKYETRVQQELAVHEINTPKKKYKHMNRENMQYWIRYWIYDNVSNIGYIIQI
jgi:hypothetical protein